MISKTNGGSAIKQSVLLLILFLPAAMCVHAQNALLKKFPKVFVEISLRDSVFSTFEDIDVTITLTNKEKKDQDVLFNKPDKKIYPWGVSVTLEDQTGKSWVKFASPEIVSSQLYTEKQLKKAGYYSLVKANETITNTYALHAIAVYEASNNKFPKGKYKLQLAYYGNVSNTILFELR